MSITLKELDICIDKIKKELNEKYNNKDYPTYGYGVRTGVNLAMEDLKIKLMQRELDQLNG